MKALSGCPVCGAHQDAFNVMPVKLNSETHPCGVAYVCPNPACNAIVSVQVDPAQLAAEIAEAVARKLGEA
jgi:hypothetical protein